MKYQEVKELFRAHEKKYCKPGGKADGSGYKPLIAHITFTEDSFDKPYSRESRTYEIQSDNKAFMPNMGGYSIYGDSVDGSDTNVRLEQYMAEEYAREGGWVVEDCILLDSGGAI